MRNEMIQHEKNLPVTKYVIKRNIFILNLPFCANFVRAFIKNLPLQKGFMDIQLESINIITVV